MMTSPLRCKLCDIGLTDANSLVAHNNGKKHKQALFTKNCQVFIEDLPKNVDQRHIKTCLALWGPLHSYKFGANNENVVVQYKEERIAQQMLHEGIIYLGHKLKVRPTTELVKLIDLKADNPCDAVISMLEGKTFSEQISIFMEIVQPNEEFNMYRTICCDLQILLNEALRGCKIHAYGSTVTGLQLMGSDVDLYVEVPESIGTDPLVLLKKAKKLMWSRRNRSFMNIVAIPKAKIPIIKCVHVQSQIHCDFNFQNMLGIYNSRFISYYLSLDVKLKPAVLVLKYWGKAHDFLGPHKCFTSYTLTMMFFFYLQNEYDFPPVWLLQQNSQYDIIHCDWNGGFESIPYQNEKMRQDQLVNLLNGFFKFYAHFDYNFFVICPFFGKGIPKVSFVSGDQLPDCFARYRENLKKGRSLNVEKSICVQDPFELCHNISEAADLKKIQSFKEYCKLGEGALNDKFRQNTNGNSIVKCEPSLFTLFTRKFSDDAKSKGKGRFVVGMGNCLTYLENTPIEAEDVITTMRKAWYHTFEKFMYRVLEDVFKMEIDVSILPWTKIKNVQGERSCYDRNFHILKIHCTGTHDYCSKRKIALKRVSIPDNITTVLEREEYISDHSVAQDSQEKVDANIYIKARFLPTEVELVLEQNQCALAAFRTFTTFLAQNIPAWFSLHEKELNESAKKKTFLNSIENAS